MQSSEHPITSADRIEQTGYALTTGLAKVLSMLRITIFKHAKNWTHPIVSDRNISEVLSERRYNVAQKTAAKSKCAL